MEPESTAQPKSDEQNSGQRGPQTEENTKLVRVLRTIVVSEDRGKYVDERTVRFKYYNAFNYSLLSRNSGEVNLTLGITSPNRGEGKTLIACNLAVSLAMGSQKKTILIDLNVQNPQLHRIFGIPQTPGLLDALRDTTIHVSKSAIEHLSVLTSGIPSAAPDPRPHEKSLPVPVDRTAQSPFLGLEQLTAFRDILYSLEQAYDFIIVDMPAISNQGVPVLFANQLNGLLVVVDTMRTKKENIDAMFRSINKNQVLGFVYNRYRDDFSS
ncbi:MAG TPA: CpsD/CapB family tyrosine-protein kinase [Bacteroidota bacterium]|nr:CpsD/CapB family tyrosine-protein kinase [Bacteroidota bacterium]